MHTNPSQGLNGPRGPYGPGRPRGVPLGGGWQAQRPWRSSEGFPRRGTGPSPVRRMGHARPPGLNGQKAVAQKATLHSVKSDGIMFERGDTNCTLVRQREMNVIAANTRTLAASMRISAVSKPANIVAFDMGTSSSTPTP